MSRCCMGENLFSRPDWWTVADDATNFLLLREYRPVEPIALPKPAPEAS